MVVVAWPCGSGTLPSLMSSVLSSLTVALAGPTFLPPPSAKCPFPLLCPLLSLSAASGASKPNFSSSWSPGMGVTWRGSLGPPTLSASFPHSSAPFHLNCSDFPSLHSVHFSSVFCPCGKARRSAVSCLTLLHLRPPSGPLVDSGVEPVETVSGPHSRAGGAFPDQALGCSRATSVFLSWVSFSLKGRGGWRAGGTGKGGKC